MRRISLAVALMSAVAAAGCSGGAKTSSDAGAAPGVLQGTFSVVVQNGQNGNTALAIKGGTITSAPAGINCGVGLPIEGCTASFALGTSVVLTATPSGAIDPDYSLAYQFNGWAGDCQGVGTCTLTGNADKYVVAAFAGKMTVHPNYTDPAVHGPAANNQTLDCASCHGANLDGQGIAVSCKGCHGGTPAGASTGLAVNVTSVSVDQATKVVTVNFNLKDGQNKPVDINGVYSANAVIGPRFALARIDKDASGNTLPYAVLTPATGNPGTITMPAVGAAAGTSGQLVEVGTGAGTYTYTSPALTKIDVAKLASTHTVWMQVTRQTNRVNTDDPKGFSVVNKEVNFNASTGATVAERREITSSAACNKCHNGWKPEFAVSAGLHSGARVEAPFCNVCHAVGTSPSNAANGPTGSKDSAVFVHMIHAGEHMGLTKLFHNMEVTYPQDPRNCTECHEGAQGDQYKTRPTRAACGACHQTIDFTVVTGGHLGGVQTDDASCTTCHSAASIVTAHTAVAAPDANNSLVQATITTGTVTEGTQPGNTTQTGASCSTTAPCVCTVAAPCAPKTANANANAGSLAAAGAVIPGAATISYEIGSVSLNASGNPVVTFKMKKNGTDVVFDAASYKVTDTTSAATILANVDKELIPGFVGGPSIYVVFSLPQDGITAPADYNGSASAYLRNLWNGSLVTKVKLDGTNNTTLAVASITATPDASGFYTVVFTSVKLPTDGSVKLLTGGVGYSYSLTSTQPLTQTDVAGYTFDTAKRTGGLVVTAPNVYKAATAADVRRAIVATDKCNSCHTQLGVSPTFHAGQRNDGPTCSFCHNPNRSSSGWSANSKDFIHAIHGAKMRTTPFNWHSACPTGSTYDATAKACKDNTTSAVVAASPWYDNVEYPGSGCLQCHNAGTYDFSAAASAAAVPNLLWSTAASGTPTAPATSTFTAGISVSPYVDLVTNYDAGYSISTTNLLLNTPKAPVTAAKPTTLVTSPVTAACFACHDSATAQAHMTSVSAGGKIYQPRSAVGGATLANTEKCLTCHGANGIAPISKMH